MATPRRNAERSDLMSTSNDDALDGPNADWMDRSRNLRAGCRNGSFMGAARESKVDLSKVKSSVELGNAFKFFEGGFGVQALLDAGRH